MWRVMQFVNCLSWGLFSGKYRAWFSHLRKKRKYIQRRRRQVQPSEEDTPQWKHLKVTLSFTAQFHSQHSLSFTAQLLIKCLLWILRRARFISCYAWLMSRQPLSFIPNGRVSFTSTTKWAYRTRYFQNEHFFAFFLNTLATVSWKRICFPIPSWEKVVRIVGTLRHLEDVVSSKEYERSHKLCSDFCFSRKVSKGQISFRAVLYLFCWRLTESPTSREKIQNTSQLKLKITFTYIL